MEEGEREGEREGEKRDREGGAREGEKIPIRPILCPCSKRATELGHRCGSLAAQPGAGVGCVAGA
jgi:hypothetical protein